MSHTDTRAHEPPAPAGHVTITAITHRGAVRDRNEDSVVLGPMMAACDMATPAQCWVPADEPMVLAVADGLGGHAAGEIASQHVARRLSEIGRQLSSAQALSRALATIDGELREHAVQHQEFDGMGSTVAGLLLTRDGVHTFNVGDSRTYRIEQGRLVQVTRDDAIEGGNTALITQCVGGRTDGRLEPHVQRVDGVAWLICSDGLSDLVTTEEVEKILATSDSDAVAVSELWRAAMAAGGRDNISIILARRE
ncbi:serine/threonine-protein phosphatase [Lipingzhangella sp. LS1_29]|uniref:Serine/threonine-protein phosphatase n=1 Tax=Lipingzhangella rawalii TaxID=2055835 RepID=A0ABU2H6E5_9ACTN|nr:serine/threonine-protein phosphatase [Lipingzhangella rawalii]MDS1270881.1 serine/threonine-protein phosphatase [Lipingzhangella rawalii]